MDKMATINHLFSDLKTIANAHTQVESVKQGVMDKLANEDYSYPLVNFHIGETGSLFIPETRITIVMSVLDLLDKDLSNEVEQTSACYEIGLHLISQLTHNYDYRYLDPDGQEITWEQVLGQTGDFLGGVQFYIPLTVQSDLSGCNQYIQYG